MDRNYILFIADEPSGIPCQICGGEVVEYSIRNDLWNRVVRKDGKEQDQEYFCAWCFLEKALWFIEHPVRLQ